MIFLLDIFTNKSVSYGEQTFSVFDFVSNKDQYNSFNTMCNYIDKNILDNMIVFIDDERIESYGYGCIDEFFQLLKKIDLRRKNVIFIVVTEVFLNLAKKYNIKNVIHEPHLEVINFYFGLYRIKNKLVGYTSENVPFVCLNGLMNPLRLKTILKLDEYDLLEQGYVTAFTQSFTNIPNHIRQKIKYDKSFESFYYKDRYKEDKNLINLIYIDRYIPGNIFLTIESFNNFDVAKSLRPLYTEKTLSPFLLRRLPLIIGMKNIIKRLEDEGFDMFTDLIDYEYDSIDPINIDEKVNLCISKNIKILQGNNFYSNADLNSRLDYNKNYVYSWLNSKVESIESNIKNILDTFI